MRKVGVPDSRPSRQNRAPSLAQPTGGPRQLTYPGPRTNPLMALPNWVTGGLYPVVPGTSSLVGQPPPPGVPCVCGQGEGCRSGRGVRRVGGSGLARRVSRIR
jgi:hypothetical protein